MKEQPRKAVGRWGAVGWMAAAAAVLVGGAVGVAEDANAPAAGHPRLYFSAADLPRLREARQSGVRAKIWRNIEQSAEWCMTLSPRTKWIAPITPDPRVENVYDRFYAIMGDLAVTEHLAFAYALSGDPRYGDRAREWVLSSCRVWSHEADGKVDGRKAYAVSRMLKGASTGYDIAYDRFTPAERDEVRQTLVRISRMYYADYFSTPTIGGPGFHTHHAIVEWSSLGVAALALLGEAPEAKAWLDAAVRKFEEHLLPAGLAPDGSQTEGASFWASTMQYRLLFMDALRSVAGQDLFAKYGKYMNVDPALASIAAEKQPGQSRWHETVVCQPTYAQLDYYSPVLMKIAREYRRPICQHLAMWDHSLGRIQETRYITPNMKQQLLFSFGGYAYVWCDDSVPAKAEEGKLSYYFPAAGQTSLNEPMFGEGYARASWVPGDLLVGAGTRFGVVAHAGGQPVLIEAEDFWSKLPAPLQVQGVDDDGSVATIRRSDNKGQSMTIQLIRPERRLTIRRRVAGDWSWWCQGGPSRKGNTVTWGDRVALAVTLGTLAAWDPTGYEERIPTAFGVLPLADPAVTRCPRAVVRPAANGEATIEIRMTGKL